MSHKKNNLNVYKLTTSYFIKQFEKNIKFSFCSILKITFYKNS